MENIEVQNVSFITKVRELFKNSKNYNLLVAGSAIVSFISSVLLFVFYVLESNKGTELAQQLVSENSLLGKITPFYGQELVGAAFFIIAVLTLVVAGVSVYLAFPYIANKDKLQLTKTNAYMSFANAVLAIVCIVFVVIILATKVNVVIGGWVVVIILYALAVVACVLTGLLGLQKDMFIPDVKKK